MTGGVGSTPIPGPCSGYGFVDLLFAHYQPTLGVTALSKSWYPCGSAGEIRTNGVLAAALARINLPSDTRVVTVEIGAHDFGSDFTSPTCQFRSDFTATLADLKRALGIDPGAEKLIAMAMYNPAVGGPGEAVDRNLLGASVDLNCADTGVELGLNDIIAQEAAAHGALLANPYPAFKAAGHAYMADYIHPNDAGHAAIAEAFRNPLPPCVATLTLEAKKQKLIKQLALSATADPDATLFVTGKAIKETTAELAANEKTNVTLKLKRNASKKLAKKLDRKGKAKTSVTAVATTEAGGTATDKIKVKLKD